MKRVFFILTLVVFNTLTYSQNRVVKGVISEANSGKKIMTGVQVTAMGAMAPEVSDNNGFFRLEFSLKKPGENIKASFVKSGYEVFNTELVDNMIIPEDPDYLFRVKMCPTGYIESKRNESYNNQFALLQKSYESQKKQLEAANEDVRIYNEKLKKLQEELSSSEKLLEQYADKFAHIDFDDVSSLYKDAYKLFEQGKLDSVTLILEKADLISRADKRVQEESIINNQQAELDQRRKENREGKEQDMQGISLLAHTYTMQFEYDKAAPLYEKLLQLDSLNITNLLDAAGFFESINKYSRAIQLNIRITEMSGLQDWQYTSAYYNLGNLYMETGKIDLALKAFENYHKQCLYLCNLNSKNDRYKYYLAISYYQLGKLYQSEGDLVNAENNFLSENKILEKICHNNPVDMEYKRELAYSYTGLGSISLRKGDLVTAEGYFVKFNRIAEDQSRNNPDDKNLKERLATSYSYLGTLYQDLNNPDKAEEYFSKEYMLHDELSTLYPRDENQKSAIARTCLDRGDVNRSKGDLTKAEEFYTKANSVSGELYKNNPISEDIKLTLAYSYERIGTLYKTRGNSEKAEENLLKAAELLEELRINNAKNEGSVSELTNIYYGLADIFVEKGDIPRAEDLLLNSYSLLKEKSVNEPENQDLKFNFAVSNDQLAIFYIKHGDLSKPVTYLNEEIRIFGELQNTNRKNISYSEALGDTYGKMAYLCETKGFSSQAISWYEKSFDIYEKLYVTTKNSLYQENYLNSIRTRLAFCKSEDFPAYHKIDSLNKILIQTADEAIIARERKKIIELYKGIVSKSSEKNSTGLLFASDYGNLSYLLLFENKPEDSETAAVKGLTCDSTQTWIKTNLAHSLLLQGKFDDACKIYIEIKDQITANNKTKTYKDIILSDFKALESAGITHPDFDRIRDLLTKQQNQQ